MVIWVDADSCPKQVRTVIQRACSKRCIQGYFVANRPLPIEETPYIKVFVTEASDQAADDYIVLHTVVGDLVVTRDIPLAKRLVDKQITTINDRGTIFTGNDINTKLSVRNFMYELSAAGLKPEATAHYSPRDLQKFSAAFDSLLHKLGSREDIRE